jgi:hypothetical protein
MLPAGSTGGLLMRSRVTFSALVVGLILGLLELFLAPIAFLPAQTLLRKAEAPPGHEFAVLDNGVIRIGVDLRAGGSIGYLADARTSINLTSIRNPGAYIGQCYYSGPRPFGKPDPQWPNWSWNPVSAGFHNYRSTILAYKNDGKTIYVKSIPICWGLKGVYAECTFETWINLDNNTAHVWNRLVNQRSDHALYIAHEQENPAAYTIGKLSNLYTYSGNEPFTNGTLRRIMRYTPLGGKNPWLQFLATEGWAAHVDDDNWGVGLFRPSGVVSFSGGFMGTPNQGGAMDMNNGYMGVIQKDILDYNIVYSYEYVLILGRLSEIRDYAYRHRPQTRPDSRFEKDRQHWWYKNCSDTGWPINGSLHVQVPTDDPQMIGPLGWWRAADVPRLYIRAAYHAQRTTAELFWSVAEETEQGTKLVETFSPKRKLTFPVRGDDAFHTYEIELASLNNYRGNITGLRFDPVPSGRPGESVDVSFISWKNYTPDEPVIRVAASDRRGALLQPSAAHDRKPALAQELVVLERRQ